MSDIFTPANDLESKLLTGQGSSTNPDWPAALDMASGMVQQLKQD